MTENEGPTEPFLGCPGNIANIYNAVDWKKSPLGPPENWSTALKNLVRTILNAPDPIKILWGPEKVVLYNESYHKKFFLPRSNGLGQSSVLTEVTSENKSMFLANMSHEIRTPLGAMIGFADLLKDPSLSSEEREQYLTILSRNGESLSVIINDILDYSKMESGRMILEYQEISPKKLAEDVVSLLKVTAIEKGIDLSYEEDETSPKSFVSDPVRARQVLLNLVSNAVKFTPAGFVRIRSSRPTNGAKPCVCFTIADTGIGIPLAQQESVFEMFVQADESTTRKFGGTGLGLSLSRRLARALGGDVRIEKSSPTTGTKIVFTLEDYPESKITEGFQEALNNLKVLPNALVGIRVLVADDSPDNQQLVLQYLKKFGAIVEFANNGVEALEKASQQPFDLILMDIQMPIMDGYTATQKLRESGYTNPIFALTAHAMTEIRAKCLRVGCDDHLTKPIRSSELISKIAKYYRRDAG
jgi:signal transduction histidine kinase